MSKRKKDIRDAEPDHEPRKKQNKALVMAIMMILAVGVPSAIAAYYLMGVNNGGGVDYGDNPDGGDGGDTELWIEEKDGNRDNGKKRKERSINSRQ